MTKKFTKNIENFSCAHCGANVTGNGYTNHCPRCLWSRDVDINPGDRKSKCGGLMRPVEIETAGDKFILIHKCEKCGKIARCKSSATDDTDAIIKVSQNFCKTKIS